MTGDSIFSKHSLQLVEKGFGMFETSLRHVSGWTRPRLCAFGRADSGLLFPQLFFKNKCETGVLKRKQFLCREKRPRTFRCHLRIHCVGFVSTAWDSYPLRGIRPHNAFGKKDFQSCFPKRLDPNFIYITGPQARFFRFPPLDRAFCGAFSPFQFHLVKIQAPMREVTGTVSTTPVVEAMDWASSMAR